MIRLNLLFMILVVLPNVGISDKPEPPSRFSYHLEIDRKSLPDGVIINENNIPFIKNTSDIPFYKIWNDFMGKPAWGVKLENSEYYRFDRKKGWVLHEDHGWHQIYLDFVPNNISKSKVKGLPIDTQIPSPEEFSLLWHHNDKEWNIKGNIIYSINKYYDIYWEQMSK